MKKAIGTGLVAIGLLVGLNSTASAANYTPDTLLTQIMSDNSGQEYEEEQLEIACSCSVTLLTNVDIDNDGLQQDDNGDNFIDVAPNTPGYFILKFGKGQGITADMFFFQNDPDLTKLVWNDSQITGGGGKSEAISHYAITTNVTTTENPTTDDVPTTGGPGDVPEPALLSLLGAGLVGAAARLRKKA